MAKDIKKDLAAARLDAENRMREVDFQVDTLSNETTTGAYFLSGDNTLTINYVEGEDSFNSWSGSMAVLMHEQKHRDNRSQGIYDFRQYGIAGLFARQIFENRRYFCF